MTDFLKLDQPLEEFDEFDELMLELELDNISKELISEEKHKPIPTSSNTNFLGHDEEGFKQYECPLCKGLIRVEEDLFYGKCTVCEATFLDYAPLPHQQDLFRDKAKFKLNIGGFGTGKTTNACAYMTNHLISIPKSRVLVTAPTLDQVKDAVLPEIAKFLPPWLIAKYIEKPKPYIKLHNGSEILVYASDNYNKIKSLNLTGFYIEEASSVDSSVFVQLKTRLRNKVARIFDENRKEIGDKYFGILSSNPEDCWFVDDFLLKSGKIYCSDNVDKETYDKIMSGVVTEKSYSSFLSSSYDNPHLPTTYIDDMCAGQTYSWKRKYVNCYLGTSEGIVYSDFLDYLVEPFAIPHNWTRVFGGDIGFRDATTLCCGAIDPVSGITYIYAEYYQEEKPMSYHAENIPKLITPYKLMYPPQFDPTIKNRNVRDGQSYQQSFYDLSGLWLEPANNSLFSGIEKVRDYMALGKLKIFNNLTMMKKEFSKYRYREKTVGNQDDIQDKHNHLMDALRYLISPMPHNPLDVASVTTSFVEKTINKEVKVTKNGIVFVSTDKEEFSMVDDGIASFGGVYGDTEFMEEWI